MKVVIAGKNMKCNEIIRRNGFALPIIIALLLIFCLLGFSVLFVAQQETVLGRIEADKVRAFYLAEAGLAKMQQLLRQQDTIPDSNNGEPALCIGETFEIGGFTVSLITSEKPCYAIATGTSGNISKKIRLDVDFLAPPLEHAIYGMNQTGIDWDFQLRGKGNPVPFGSGGRRGGKDIVNGNIFVDGDAYLYEESSVNQAPAPNPYDLKGDVKATGIISENDSANISGTTSANIKEPGIVDLIMMDYANSNTHNVGKIFADAKVSSGYLPKGSELRDVFVKNPGDRNKECKTTSGDDYFFEPSGGFIEGTDFTAETPLHAGKNRVYYIDGDLWIHSKNDTYGFNMDGTATIVVTGDIHICDNLAYADEESMLGLVALGKYDSYGNLISGGNIYFGDPTYGTMYITSGMMFAANNFLFNTNPITSEKAEPVTGFTVYGNFAAMGKVDIVRDWYDKNTGYSNKPQAAVYNPDAGQWVDAETGTALTSTEVNSLRHYQMVVNYDYRVRNSKTQPPGLPRGGTQIFAGCSNWKEL